MLYIDEYETTEALKSPEITLEIGNDTFHPTNPERSPLQRFRDNHAANDDEALLHSLDLNAPSGELTEIAKFQLIYRSDDLISNFIQGLVASHFEQINMDCALTPASVQRQLNDFKALWKEEVHVARWLLARHPELTKEMA